MSESASLIIILLLVLILAMSVVLLILLILRTGSSREERVVDDIENLLDETEDHVTERVGHRISDIKNDIGRWLQQDSEENRKNRMELSGMIRQSSASQTEALDKINDRMERKLSLMQQEQNTRLTEHREKTEAVLKSSIAELVDTNRKKLDEIQTGINERLDVSLNERLDQSFKSVGEQLNRLYVSLGELSKLESGVNSLNRTLTNVKTRGVFGETQLENILANILNPSLYDRNVVTKVSEGANRDAVEFAVKIPDKETAGEFMYLPIDSKFPADVFDRIRKASEEGNAESLKAAVKELEIRIRQEARDIQQKYLDPPHTTDFAIMFLPTEALYAEVLRVPGLTEEIQKKNHIVVTGPTTVAALLNSLSIGFRYMAVNRDSQNILKLLSAIKSQYGTLSELIETADKRMEMARKATTELQHRTEIINKKLSAVEEIDPLEAQSLLGITEKD
ncbi:MAG: DNA recombination protein RmuC [Lachnospiraceae bacterium]|nr:DNA recombination protein RmuC [Lachnospiraceae bacterium]